MRSGGRFSHPRARATAQDVPKFADGGVRSVVYELEDVQPGSRSSAGQPASA